MTVSRIVVIDAVFSFDSIITAGGTAKHVEIMIAAVVIAMTIMFLFSPAIAGFIHKHPTLKMLALSFLQPQLRLRRRLSIRRSKRRPRPSRRSLCVR